MYYGGTKCLTMCITLIRYAHWTLRRWLRARVHNVMQLEQHMDKKLERQNADRVLRLFAKHIKSLGFVRSKPTFFVREAGLLIEFIHIHKYSFGPFFRMHICLRVLNESTEFVALCGPTELDLFESAKFEFGDATESTDKCADVMADFVGKIVEPWFKRWSDRKFLLGDDSPLYDDQKVALKAALKGQSDPIRVALSRSLLKIA